MIRLIAPANMMVEQQHVALPLRYPSWLEGIQEGVFADTDLPARASVVVIGAGLAGVMTTYHLRTFGVNVVLLEQDSIARGASGRNGGHIAAGSGDFGGMVDSHGPDLAKTLWEFQTTSCTQLSTLVRELDIGADIRFNGRLDVALDEAGVVRVERAGRLLAQSGLSADQWKVLSAEDCENKTGSSSFLRGLFRPLGGQLSPGKLAFELAQAAANRGARIKCSTRVLELGQRMGGSLVVTDKGNIFAEHVVLATNTIDNSFVPVLGGMIEPVQGQVIATVPIDRRLWDFGLGTIDGYVYWLQDLSLRIVLGGMRHVARGMRRSITDVTRLDSRIGASQRGFLFDYFGHVLPESLGVAYEWAGTMGASRDGLPLVGRFPLFPYQNIWLIAGFGGHGMPVIPGCALALAQMILGRTPSNFVEAFLPKQERFGGGV